MCWKDINTWEEIYENPLIKTIKTDTSYNALFSNIPVLIVSISPESSGNGSFSKDPDKESYDFTEKVSITAIPDSNSVFEKWSGDVPNYKQYDNPLSITMDDVKNIKASFLKKPILTIKSTGEGSGSISPSIGEHIYGYGDEVEIEATPDSGSYFKEWTGDVAASDKEDKKINITMDSDKTITAEFAKLSRLTITTSGDGSGTVVYSDELYIEGDEIEISAIADDGSTFAGWTGDVSSYSENKTITMGSFDMEINAEFKHNIWTIMVYLNADNNLEYNGICDINEMEEEFINGSGINLIALVDRTPNEYDGQGNWTDTRLYQIKKDDETFEINSKRLSSTELGIDASGITELNMGDPQTAINFIKYCKASHPADNYAFIVWNHGTGWRSSSIPQTRDRDFNETLILNSDITDGVLQKGGNNTQDNFKAVASDDTSDDILYTQELGTIFAAQPVDVVGFDLCLGAMIEVAYEIKDHANYMIASEETEPGDGWEYDYLFSKFKTTSLTQLDLVQSAVDAYENRYSNQTGLTLSGIDLSKIDNVMEKLNTFSDELYNSITTTAIQQTVRENLYKNAEDFYSNPGDLNIDLLDAAQKIRDNTDYAETEADALIAAIEEAVVAEWHNTNTTENEENTDAHGLAIHLISLNGSSGGHNPAYIKNYTPTVDYPLSFVQNSTWVPCEDGTGLLNRIFYAKME